MSKRARDSEETGVDSYPTPEPASMKRQVVIPVQTFREKSTLSLLKQAQIDLAAGKINKHTREISLSCDDCFREINEQLSEEDHSCQRCLKTVCRYCSIKAIYNDNNRLCLECLR